MRWQFKFLRYEEEEEEEKKKKTKKKVKSSQPSAGSGEKISFDCSDLTTPGNTDAAGLWG